MAVHRPAGPCHELPQARASAVESPQSKTPREAGAGSKRVSAGLSRLFGALAVSLGWAMVAPAQDMRIQFAEKVAIAAAPGHTEFDAYGRRFSLTLENNSRLLAALPAAQKAD